MKAGHALGHNLDIATLRQSYDAVFVGTGLAGVNKLGLAGEDTLSGVVDAVKYIAELRQANDLAKLPVGRNVVVIGGGMTAVDVAVQSKKLGAESVTIVYRRGAAEMSATQDEQEWAQTNGVRIRHWAAPHRLLGADGHVTGVEFMRTQPDAAGRAVPTGDTFVLEADMVLKAVGQVFVSDPLGQNGHLALALEDGRIAVNGQRRTSLGNVFAGGDCVAGQDLTVAAVQDGKLAAEAIHRQLMG